MGTATRNRPLREAEDHCGHVCVDELAYRGHDALRKIRICWTHNMLSCRAVKERFGLRNAVEILETIRDELRAAVEEELSE